MEGIVEYSFGLEVACLDRLDNSCSVYALL